MDNASSLPSGCSKFLGSAVLAVIIAIAGLAWAVYTFYQNNQDTQQELNNQATQVAQQQTQIALLAELNQLQAQQFTLVAEQSNIEGQLLTPISAENGNISLTATAVFVQAAQIESTSQAIATRQKGIEATQTAVAGQPSPKPPSPIIALNLPFQDSFNGSIRPEWRTLSGDILIQDGWLGATKDVVVLGIGDDSLKDLTLSFDYRNLRGVNEIMVTFDQKVRLVIGQDGSGWQALDDNVWTNISLFEGVGVSGQLSLSIIGNKYTAFRNQEPVQEITYGTPVGGPIMVTIVVDRFIDNFYLSQP